MKKISCIVLALITFTWPPAGVLAMDKYAEGLGSAAKNYGLGRLVKEAKTSAPNSYLPTIIESVLLGISLTSDPTTSATTILEGVYPGSLAAGAISQLLEKHGADIARMTYWDSSHGDQYSDPSIIQNQGTAQRPDPIWALCSEMFEVDGGWVRTCYDLTKQIQSCNGIKNENPKEVKYCKRALSEFYENMEIMGKTQLVKQAGKVAAEEFKDADIGGQWIYYGGKGSGSIDQNDEAIEMNFNWNPNKTDRPRPHYSFNGTISGRMIHGTWKCNVKGKPGYGPGEKFVAEVDKGGSSIRFISIVDPDSAGWKNVSLIRK